MFSRKSVLYTVSVLVLILYSVLLILLIGFRIYVFILIAVLSLILIGIIYISESYISDLSKLSELNSKLKDNDFNFSPKFQNKEFINLKENIDNITSVIFENNKKALSVDKMKEDFIYVVSHNLRTPMVTISGYVEILSSSKNISEEDLQIIKRINTSLKQLNLINEEILSLVYLDSPDFKVVKEDVNLSDFVKNIVENKIKESSMSVGFSFDEHIGIIVTDKSILEKSINNIIDNSIKFNHSEGLISVSIYKETEKVVIKISDTGIGISPENLKNIFVPFSRKTSVLNYDYEGLGLGLYIAKISLEKIGATLKVESIENKGSDFYIYL